MTRLNDVELNEHCLKLEQIAGELHVLLRDGKRGLLWVKLDEARDHINKAIFRTLEIDHEPVYIDINADKRSS